MCGFLISSNTRIISDNVFKLALENLHHRGPDQKGIFTKLIRDPSRYFP